MVLVVAVVAVGHLLKPLNLCHQNFVVAVTCVRCVGCCATNENVFDRLQVKYDT